MARRTALIVVLVAAAVSSCADVGVPSIGDAASDSPTASASASSGSTAAVSAAAATATTVRVLLAGDVMLGRGVAPVVTADPDGVFQGIRRTIRRADIAAANVESPLTLRSHASANPYALEADPSAAELIASAGFDLAGVANNHAGDAGRGSVIDTIDALSAVGIQASGGGGNLDDAWTPTIVEVRGVRVAFLAIDGSAQGVEATASLPGIAVWDADRAEGAVVAAARRADVVIVGLHGGVEYWPGTDPVLRPLADALVSWGVDVVWGHGPHVGQPIGVVDPDGDGRYAVIATSLGNLLFDQLGPTTREGLVLEVLVDRDGLIAHRVGVTRNTAMRISFDGWRTPDGDGDVAMLDGTWWSLDRTVETSDTSVAPFAYLDGDVMAASRGDLDGDGSVETLFSFRHPAEVRDADPLGAPPTDSDGRSAHVGVLAADGSPVWMSRRPPHPIGATMACDGSAAFAYTQLDDPAVIAVGAGTWGGFGFVLAPELAGPGTIGCGDVDHDGHLEPVIVRRAHAPTGHPDP